MNAWAHLPSRAQSRTDHIGQNPITRLTATVRWGGGGGGQRMFKINALLLGGGGGGNNTILGKNTTTPECLEYHPFEQSPMVSALSLTKVQLCGTNSLFRSVILPLSALLNLP